MGKLLRYLKGHQKETVMAPLFKLLEASFELLVPLVMACIMDIGIQNKDLPYILRMGGILFLLGAIGLVCSITAQYFAAKAATGFGTALRNDLFAKINQFSYTELDQFGISTLITRVTNDTNQVQNAINLFLRLFLRSPFIVLGAMVMAFTIDIPCAWIFVVTIPLLSIVVFGVLLVSMPLYKKVQRQLDRVLLATRENLTGARVIRAFHREQDELAQFEQESGKLMGLQLFVGKISALLNPITYVILNFAIILVVWVGGKQVNMGMITQGEVVALVNYMSQILVELLKLANLIITFSKALASATRLNLVFEQSPAISANEDAAIKPKAGAPKVQFSDAGVLYYGDKEESLSEVSFTAQIGETIGIIGGTGAGKTSLVNLIARFYDVSSGAVFVDGVDVRSYPPKMLRSKIGIVPQKAVLFSGTVRENLLWGNPSATDEEIYRALEIAQAKEFIEKKGQGLDLMILQGGQNLSGGQRQRLTIARALVRQPEILILDDSACALDFATDARLRKAIHEKTRGMTVFLVSQRAATVKNADQILVLEDGIMVGCGTHQTLLENCGIYREICLSQLSGKGAE